MIKAILLDIEGTTTPISFVHDVLFPFARQRMGDFLKAHTDDPDVAPVLQDIADITGMPLTPDQTLAFGGVQQISSDNKVLNRVPYVAAGTFANLAWDERETLLKHCPEIKTIFPSLHEPSCFGAHPKPDTCRQSICALQENLPSSGC